jgi:Flp pilus assembly pilin Flp
VHHGRGQGLVEYALIISIVAVMAIAGLLLFGPAVDAILSTVTGSV